jgi:glycosyltransferase involved in cell wall biosynthesis
MPEHRKITAIVPARNEVECLPGMLAELPREILHEILVVDGHSTDGTPGVISKLGYTVIPQEGAGYGMGVATGIRQATGEYLTFLDADGSYDPKALYALQRTLEEGGYDVVFCSRYLPDSGSDDDTLVRYIGNKIFTWLLRTLHGVRITDSLFLYVLARRGVFDRIEMTSRHFDYCVEFPIRVHAAGLKYTEIPSRERPRMAGVSKVNAFLDGLKIGWTICKLKWTRRERGRLADPRPASP